MSDSESLPSNPVTRERVKRVLRPWLWGAAVLSVLVLLFYLPWWSLVFSTTDWPVPVVVAGTIVFGAGFLAFPVMMYLGHGHRRLDWAVHRRQRPWRDLGAVRLDTARRTAPARATHRRRR